MPVILTDIDDTVLQFSTAFQRWAQARGHTAVGDVREKGCIGTVFGLEDEPVWDLIREFCSEEAFATIEAEPDALEVLPRLHAMGYEFVAITACCNEPKSVESRIRNLETVFGFEWKAVHCTGLQLPKLPYLKMYESSLWVEDNFGHAVDGAELGHKSVVLTRDYNSDNYHPNVTRVNDWKEIESLCRFL